MGPNLSPSRVDLWLYMITTDVQSVPNDVCMSVRYKRVRRNNSEIVYCSSDGGGQKCKGNAALENNSNTLSNMFFFSSWIITINIFTYKFQLYLIVQGLQFDLLSAFAFVFAKLYSSITVVTLSKLENTRIASRSNEIKVFGTIYYLWFFRLFHFGLSTKYKIDVLEEHVWKKYYR